LRIGEIIAIKQSQVYTTSGGVKNALRVIRQKTTQTLYSDIPIHPKLRDQLLKYKEDLSKGTWLFPSDSAASHLGRCRAHLILRNAFDGLRLDDASTHSMRRYSEQQIMPSNCVMVGLGNRFEASRSA
jgi:hypothetical protein